MSVIYCWKDCDNGVFRLGKLLLFSLLIKVISQETGGSEVMKVCVDCVLSQDLIMRDLMSS